MSDSITVVAPASIGNVGSGFDVLGLCLERPEDELEAWITEAGGVEIVSISGDEGRLSRKPEENTAGIAILEFLRMTNQSKGVAFRLHKKMPFGSGLGSSAASAVAGAFVANELFGRPMSKRELLPIALEGEKFASKGIHADNVAPSLLGGCVLARGAVPFDIVHIPAPRELRIVLVYPHVNISTSDARAIIPKEIPLSKAVRQWGNLAGLIAGMHQSDFELIGRSLEDVVIEPFRSQFIPHFDELKQAARHAGALGFSISGSGPTCFAMTYNRHAALEIGKAMSGILDNHDLDHTIFHSKVNLEGAKVKTT